MTYINDLFSLEDKVAVAIGAGGVLAGAMAEALSRAGAKLAIVDLNLKSAEKKANHIINTFHQDAFACLDVGIDSFDCLQFGFIGAFIGQAYDFGEVFNLGFWTSKAEDVFRLTGPQKLYDVFDVVSVFQHLLVQFGDFGLEQGESRHVALLGVLEIFHLFSCQRVSRCGYKKGSHDA